MLYADAGKHQRNMHRHQSAEPWTLAGLHTLLLLLLLLRPPEPYDGQPAAWPQPT
jgi:hypothetical protein